MDEIVTVKEVREDASGFSISTEESTGFYLDKKHGALPKIGDRIELFTTQGCLIRGMALNGVMLYYKTDAELDQEHKEWCAKNDQEKRERFAKNRAALDADYEALPANFKARIDRFRASRPDWRVQFEAYEMSCCRDAVKIAAASKTLAQLEAFCKAPWEEQRKMVPGLFDGHSDNSFACACMLARFQIERPDLVPQAHGALCLLVGCLLVGCEEYGDSGKKKVADED